MQNAEGSKPIAADRFFKLTPMRLQTEVEMRQERMA